MKTEWGTIHNLCDSCGDLAEFYFKRRGLLISTNRTYCNRCLIKKLKELGLEK